MIRAILLCLLFAFVVPVCIVPEHAAAADAKILDATIDRYMDAAAQWEPRIKRAAVKMFWILATVSMVFTFAFMIARGNVGLGDFFGEFLRFVVTVGFFYWLLNNGSAIVKSVIQSFGQLGLEASSTYQAELSPSNLVSFGLELIGGACLTFGEQDIATSVVALLLSIAVAVLFGMIAAMMVQLLCTAWVLVYAGIIVLGFGGGRWTQDIAINYFKTVLGLALQTFTFCLLVGIGQQEVEKLISAAHQVKQVVVKGYVYDSTISTTSMTITEGCVLFLFTVILFMLVKSVPNMVAGIISGSSTGGVGLSGGGVITGAAALASGGTMVAAQMAGAGMALNSAYQQTKENMAQGVGKFAGGAGGGGLAGAMRTAGDFMTNLASGAGGAVKESLQKSTSGGAVSANIDASRQANAAAFAAAQAEESGDEAPAEASADGDGGGADLGGGISAGNSGGNSGESADGGADAGGESSAVGGSGLSKSGFGSGWTDPGWQAAVQRDESAGSSSLSKPGYGSKDRGTSLQKPEYREKF